MRSRLDDEDKRGGIFVDSYFSFGGGVGWMMNGGWWMVGVWCLF